MPITKHQISFDPAGSDQDEVGAFLKSSDGTLLTHTTIASKEALDVNIAGSDIQIDVDLVHTEDSVRLGDGTSFFTSTSENGDISLDVHISNSDLDIRDLDASQDNVAISDGTDTLAINTDGSINSLSTEAGFSTCNNPAAVSINTTAVDLLATELANRKEITIQNTGPTTVYIGCDSSVTVADGILLPKDSTATFKFGPGIDVHAIGNAAGGELRIMELA